MRALLLITMLSLLGMNTAGGDDCGELVCFYPSEADMNPSWKPDARMSKSARKKEAKKQRKRKDVALQAEVIDGRGSAFIDGRYLPPAGLPVKPGKHEFEVRDGDEVIAVGVLSIPANLGSLRVEVHADRG